MSASVPDVPVAVEVGAAHWGPMCVTENARICAKPFPPEEIAKERGHPSH